MGWGGADAGAPTIRAKSITFLIPGRAPTVTVIVN